MHPSAPTCGAHSYLQLCYISVSLSKGAPGLARSCEDTFCRWTQKVCGNRFLISSRCRCKTIVYEALLMTYSIVYILQEQLSMPFSVPLLPLHRYCRYCRYPGHKGLRKNISAFLKANPSQRSESEDDDIAPPTPATQVNHHRLSSHDKGSSVNSVGNNAYVRDAQLSQVQDTSDDDDDDG